MLRFAHPATMTATQREEIRRATCPPGATAYRAKDGGFVAYVWPLATMDGWFIVKAYRGKALKACHHYRHKAANLPAVLQRLFDHHASNVERQANARKAAVNKLQVGHILRSSWGYDQTNINYYQVTEVSGCMVTVCEIGGIRLSGDHGWMQGKCVPDPDNFKGKPQRCRSRGDSVRISSCQLAFLWEGKPDHWTGYA
jgi:hypothetical protein